MDNIETRKRKRTKNGLNRDNNINPLSNARRAQTRTGTSSDIDADSDNGSSNKSAIEQESKSHKKSGGNRSTNKAVPNGLNKNKVMKVTKADLKAKELWHKKSGAGYSLFIQYYGLQPRGIVSDVGSDQEKSNNSKERANIVKSKMQQGRGQSRAAKKRRKKKNTEEEVKSENDNHDCHENAQKSSKYCSGDDHNDINSRNDNISLSEELHYALQQLQDQEQNNMNQYNHIRNFLAALSQPLPLTFRIRQHKDEMRRSQKEAFKQILYEKYDHLIRPVSYDPDQRIYQAVPNSNLCKATLGKVSPQLKSLILDGTSTGLIARQEMGSIMPVIALSRGKYISYGSKVLDMCSSPGSKTLQALEIIASNIDHQNSNDRDEGYDHIFNDAKKRRNNPGRPGRMVANDIHPLRIDSLKDAISRSGLSATLTDRIVYTNYDASAFPTPKSGKLFDCIIADVPCSGDGTIRKDPRILSGWMPSIGNSLHAVQKKILKRALQLVKVGGVVVYSTCSLNPIEDEAVVSSVLSWANGYYNSTDTAVDDKDGGNVELIELSNIMLPTMKRSPGVTDWRVANYVDEKSSYQNDEDKLADDVPEMQWYRSYEEAKIDRFTHAVNSMWPPPATASKNMNLHRCVRLRPQDNDTGGFFVALIKKKKEISF